MPKPKIRRAREGDARAICEMIVELGHYYRSEGASPDVSRLRFELERGTHTRLYCWVADDSGQLLGYALAYQEFDSFCTGWRLKLEDLFVKESHRSNGIGTMLLSAVANEVLLGKHLKTLSLTGMRHNVYQKQFFLRHGAVELHFAEAYCFDEKALKRLAYNKD